MSNRLILTLLTLSLPGCLLQSDWEQAEPLEFNESDAVAISGVAATGHGTHEPLNSHYLFSPYLTTETTNLSPEWHVLAASIVMTAWEDMELPNKQAVFDCLTQDVVTFIVDEHMKLEYCPSENSLACTYSWVQGEPGVLNRDIKFDGKRYAVLAIWEEMIDPDDLVSFPYAIGHEMIHVAHTCSGMGRFGSHYDRKLWRDEFLPDTQRQLKHDAGIFSVEDRLIMTLQTLEETGELSRL